MIDAYPIFLISAIAAGVIAPAHATVDSILAKLRIPSTSCLTTCALASFAMKHATMMNRASVGTFRCMPYLLCSDGMDSSRCMTSRIMVLLRQP